MVRTQIRLTEEQMQALRRLSSVQGRSMAELVRAGVDRILKETTHSAAAQRFLNAAGRFNSRLGDVSENHDRYLAEDFG